MTRVSALVRMLILQSVLHWCSAKEKTYTLGSFKRLHKQNRFLKVEWDEHKKAFHLSFTGFLTEHGTTFILKHENDSNIQPFTIHPAGTPNYILAVEDGSLVVTTLPDLTMRPDMKKYQFLKRRVSLHYSDGRRRRTPAYHVIQSKAIPFKKIKSNKSGKVSLSFNWKDCGAWIEIKSSK